MSYDFVLFETDGDPGNARISKSPLTERIDFATASTTPVLSSLAQGLGETAPTAVKLEEDAIQLSGDRCLYVVTSYNSAETAAEWLTQVALDYGLGLADMNADAILLFGDEDTDAVVQLENWFSPAFSAYGLPHLLIEAMRVKDSQLPYLRVTRANDDSTYIQTLYKTDEKQWFVEYSANNVEQSTHVNTIKEVTVLIEAWFNGASDFGADHEWTPTTA